MMTIDSLSKVVLSYRDDISNKKLQKLAYYVYSWYMTLYGEEIATMTFEAWEHGPVCRRLYSSYRNYGWSPIPRYTGFVLASDEDIAFVESVLHVYGDFSADELERMTHEEKPWNDAKKRSSGYGASNTIITKESIIAFYSNQVEVRAKIMSYLRGCLGDS